ncbi:hypothetical protein RSOLAG22IIIB_08150 [Rhizoctonia solani]|uniref:Transmembrane protein n=1 Tax=Rhizoctonia solani TaxID=456999 RepID=A0A0K6FS63_9AGAM|nr:hypothetical protein RSOLAG22IIIB_08150 [Rhizoctonia solani]
MSSFLRLVGLAAVVFSLGLAVSALPIANIHLKSPTGTDVVSRLFFKLCIESELEAKLKALLLCGSIQDLTVKIDVVVALLKGCSDELLKIGADVVVDADAKISLVACIVSIVTLCVQVFATLSLKFGLAICAEIDVVLRLLLANLAICVDGILVLIVKVLAQATVGVMAQIQLKLCLGVLGL